MKKTLSTILLTGLIAVSLGACGGGNTSNATSTGGNNPTSSQVNSQITSTTEQSPIKSLTVKNETVEIKIDESSLLCNKSLIEIADKYQVRILVCAVKRENEVFIPKGDFVLQNGDYVYITADAKEITKAFRKLKIYKEVFL